MYSSGIDAQWETEKGCRQMGVPHIILTKLSHATNIFFIKGFKQWRTIIDAYTYKDHGIYLRCWGNAAQWTKTSLWYVLYVKGCTLLSALGFGGQCSWSSKPRSTHCRDATESHGGPWAEVSPVGVNPEKTTSRTSKKSTQKLPSHLVVLYIVTYYDVHLLIK